MTSPAKYRVTVMSFIGTTHGKRTRVDLQSFAAASRYLVRTNSLMRRGALGDAVSVSFRGLAAPTTQHLSVRSDLVMTSPNRSEVLSIDEAWPVRDALTLRFRLPQGGAVPFASNSLDVTLDGEAWAAVSAMLLAAVRTGHGVAVGAN